MPTKPAINVKTDERTAGQDWEFHLMEARRLLDEANAEEARGHLGVAQALRRRMRGHMAAATRIGRREGWVSR